MDNQKADKPARKRSLTEVTLGWLAERMRRAETIRASIEKGDYKVDTRKIAESIMNKPQ